MYELKVCTKLCEVAYRDTLYDKVSLQALLN